MISPEVLHDELRVLLGFWLEMPLNDYLDDLEGAGPTVARVLRRRAATRAARARAPRGDCPQLERPDRWVASHNLDHPAQELTTVLERLKTFAKRVHRAAKQAEKSENPAGAARRENSMPLEIAQVLYDLAGALALTRSYARIVGLSDDRYRKNVAWLLNQPWLDTTASPCVRRRTQTTRHQPGKVLSTECPHWFAARVIVSGTVTANGTTLNGNVNSSLAFTSTGAMSGAQHRQSVPDRAGCVVSEGMVRFTIKNRQTVVG